jgi:hypothetical protein
MMNTLRSIMTAFLIVGIGTGLLVTENSAWAKSCPQHQAVNDQVADLNSQTQQSLIPFSTQQREQTIESHSAGWGMGMVGTLIFVAALALGLMVRLRRERIQHSLISQLSLPYSNSEPLLITSAV